MGGGGAIQPGESQEQHWGLKSLVGQRLHCLGLNFEGRIKSCIFLKYLNFKVMFR